jgi:D-beta-D-heptose 7-phosphate kinase/D-beta-D-heptose 1-phosphate adenosyltransferase
LRVLLIGESCIDEYHYGTCSRISPEAPVPIFDFVYSTKKYGMASNVKQNLESFGCSVDFITNDANDLIKRRLIDMKSKQQLIREDIGREVESAKVDIQFDYDAVVISDYNKGLLTEELIEYICNTFSGFKFVDTKKKDLSCFKNCIIKHNNYEQELVTVQPIDSEIIVTRGKDGAIWDNKVFIAPEVELYDVTGAGDVFLASLTSLYCSTFNMEESIQKSVILASKSVEHSGIYKLTDEDINDICD